MQEQYIYYKETASKYSTEEKRLDKSYSTVSTLRLITFLLGAGLIFIGAADGIRLVTFFGIVILLGFVCLVIFHEKIAMQSKRVAAMHLSAEKYVARFGDGWHGFEDTGKQFAMSEDVVAHDVDLLGANSLYQMISVCHTGMGKKYLAEELKLKNVNVENLKMRQQAISELTKKREFGLAFETAGIVTENQKKKINVESLQKYCNSSEDDKLPGWYRVLMVLLPIVEIALVILAVLGVVNYGIPIIGFIFNLAYTCFTNSFTKKIINPIYGLSDAVKGYSDMIELFANEQLEAEELRKMQEELSKENGAVQGFKRLGGLIQACNISFNPLVHQLLSGFILWDCWLGVRVHEWKSKYGAACGRCFDLIARLEMLLSLSVIGKVRKCSEAAVDENEKKVFVDAQNIYHPLIRPDSVVANSVKLKGGITVITGSNMSGKTTFLRTVAINLVLAYLGAPVCGEAFSASYMKIFTSMRITDDIAGGISTFYAEILRIKTMAEYKQENLPMICLIDEIFKGTNSADRIVGAKHVIRGLGSDNCITIVSTHDFELCSLQNNDGGEAVNYHFEEYYEDDQLKFDYCIKNGRCTTTNAKEILRMAGFDIQN